MSSPAPARCSSAATALWQTMNMLAWAPRASPRSRPTSGAGSSRVVVPPRWPTVAGLGRSTGSGISSGMPDSALAQ
ncbi:hypothetical protein GCM10018952_17090 [Streptosporangium vulgare]